MSAQVITLVNEESIQAFAGPCLLAGLEIHDETELGNTFSIYDDVDAVSHLVLKLELREAGHIVINFPHPIAFERGIWYETVEFLSIATFILT